MLDPALSEAAEADIGDEALRSALAAADRLVLRLTETTATFYDADGLRRIYPLNRHARWDGATLRIERPVGRGVRLIEAYAVDPATGRLTVSIIVKQRGLTNARRIRYVYDPVR